MTILDTSVWISLLNKQDSTHQKARKLIEELKGCSFEIMDSIYSETLTVLRNKVSERQCIAFTRLLRDASMKITLSSSKVFTQANFFFFQFNKLSFTDCLLLAAAKLNNAELVTFDKNLQKAWNKVKK